MSRTMESAGNGEKKTVTEFRTVAREELTMELFSQFRRRQVVDGCLRQEQEQWVVKSDPFVDQWSREDYEFLIKCLKNTLETTRSFKRLCLCGRKTCGQQGPVSGSYQPSCV